MGDLGEAVGPAAGFSNLRSLRHSSAPLPTPCDFATPRARPGAPRAFGAAPRSALGTPWKPHGSHRLFKPIGNGVEARRYVITEWALARTTSELF